MQSAQTPTTHIIGAGPIGLLAAVRASLTGPVVLHVTADLASYVGAECMPMRRSACSIEVLPASRLALLCEMGIHPAAVGVKQFYSHRHAAWEQSQVQTVRTPPVAYVERPALELVLMGLVRRLPLVEIRATPREGLKGLRDGEPGRVFDATGRRAVTAGAKHVLRGGPVGRTWACENMNLTDRDREFRIAALPDGYVYRLATPRRVLLGWCGSRRLVSLSPADWRFYLDDADAGWVALGPGGMPADSMEWLPTKAGPAGAQRCDPSSGLMLLGDAAFARDALCSQGLALGMTDVFYALAVRDSDEARLWEEHRTGQYIAHLKQLRALTVDCCFRNEPFWYGYRDAIDAELAALGQRGPVRQARLNGGRLAAHVT